MNWQRTAAVELGVGQRVQRGRFVAKVTGWTWRADRGETVIDLIYVDAPEFYLGSSTQMIVRDGDTVSAWCAGDEHPQDQCTTAT